MKMNAALIMKTEAIIYDLGGVLIDWNPKYLFDQLFDDEEKKKYFLENICTLDWHEEQDGGRPIKEATSELIAKHPEWKEYIAAFYDRWDEMFKGPIEASVDIFRDLKEKGRYKFYALTNWSAELFPYALENYHFLHWFDGRVVSGEEKMRKPAREIYETLLNRFQLQPQQTLFIDDNLRNIKAAMEMGIPSIQFQSPAQLKKELQERKIL